MIEVLDFDGYRKMCYSTLEEKELNNKLLALKPPTGVYYQAGKKMAYHWILHPSTVAKLKIDSK